MKKKTTSFELVKLPVTEKDCEFLDYKIPQLPYPKKWFNHPQRKKIDKARQLGKSLFDLIEKDRKKEQSTEIEIRPCTVA